MDIIIRNARISDKENLKDVAVKDGKIIKIEENIAEKASEEIDADGRVLIPGLVESHIHMDKALIADRLPNRSGTLAEAIKVTAELKPTFTKEDVEERATKVLMMLIQHGITHIRTHSEFDPSQGFTGFETILKLKEKFKNVVDIQVVAFPQEGIFKTPGTEKMMYEAMEMGASAVLVNTAIAVAGNPVAMAVAFKEAVIAGQRAFEAGPGMTGILADASSPLTAFLD